MQLLLQSRAQPSVEVDEVAVSWKRIRSISMQKEQNASNSHCCRGFRIPGQAGCYSSVRSRKSEIKQDAWCACLHINTRSVFSLACTAQCNWCWRAGAIPELPTLVHAASPYVCSASFLLLQTPVTRLNAVSSTLSSGSCYLILLRILLLRISDLNSFAHCKKFHPLAKFPSCFYLDKQVPEGKHHFLEKSSL